MSDAPELEIGVDDTLIAAQAVGIVFDEPQAVLEVSGNEVVKEEEGSGSDLSSDGADPNEVDEKQGKDAEDENEEEDDDNDNDDDEEEDEEEEEDAEHVAAVAAIRKKCDAMAEESENGMSNAKDAVTKNEITVDKLPVVEPIDIQLTDTDTLQPAGKIQVRKIL